MESISINRAQRIRMFFNEYYFGVSLIFMVFRFIGGPILFLIGLNLYSDSMSRFGVGYGGILVAFSIYYGLKPFWWIAIKWEYYKTVDFELEATAEKLIIREGESESQTLYSKFEKIFKRKTYFALRVQKGFKLYLPFECLSKTTFDILSKKSSR